MNILEFRTLLEKYKAFKELSEQYKTDKFISLYSKMYEYMLSVPKEKIVYKCILSNYFNYGLLNYINHFLLAKDFYKWKERIYSLLTEKIGSTNYKKYELLYRSKAKEFFNQYLEKQKSTFRKIYNTDNPMKSKEIQKKVSNIWQNKTEEEINNIQEKRKSTNLKIYGKENPMQCKVVQDKMKVTCEKKYGLGITNYSQAIEVKKKKEDTCMKNYRVKHPLQAKEVQDKMKVTCLERLGVEYPMQSKEVQEKSKETSRKKYNVDYYTQTEEYKERAKATNLEKYGEEYCFSKNSNNYSNIASECLTDLDILLGIPEESMFQPKCKEFRLYYNNEKNYFSYDYCIPSKKFLIEFQGMYTHGLKEDQKYVFNIPVEEIYKRDEEKRILAEKNGYKIFYVYENDYKSNKSKCLENLLKEIKNYVQSQKNMIYK